MTDKNDSAQRRPPTFFVSGVANELIFLLIELSVLEARRAPVPVSPPPVLFPSENFVSS